MNEQRSDKEIIRDSIEYLENHRILTMATASVDGEPNAAALEYASLNLDVFVTSRPNSLKVQNVRENPKVFYEIHDDIEITRDNIKKLKALQVLAKADVIYPGSKEFEEKFTIMEKKFPIFRGMKKDSRVIIHFAPKILWYLNYKRKFFYRERVDFE
ncbi:MAG: pyridoxamine 5'-phosphate oxidase family protein [Promethearchaeota archaeon]